LRGYFRDHGQDFGAGSQEEYARLASLFLQDAPRRNLPMKIDKDGIIRIYDPTTNTFGAYNPNGTTRTFFKPEEGINYCLRQHGGPPIWLIP
jgi:pyocin large subunit-like protein